MISSKAYAKLNLGLKILNKREDNYHNIETIVTTISLRDKIEIEIINSGLKLYCQGAKLPIDIRNIAYRAADIFLREYEIKTGIMIRLIKNIPVGGGLGGGSSDAASTLKLMRTLLKPDLPHSELLRLGKKLGMDVPFFLKGGTACARARGDELEYFDLPTIRFVVHYPGFPISTRWAYENIALNLTKEENWIKIVKSSLETQNIGELKKYLINDFERLVFKIHPELEIIKEKFLELGAKVALLSGSGSCVYAIVDVDSEIKISNFLNSVQKVFFVAETVKPD